MNDDYFFDIIIQAVECPYHKEHRQPDGKFGYYFCNHPILVKKGYGDVHRCGETICPIVKDTMKREIYWENVKPKN